MDSDAWNWSVEDVQTFFRDSAADYIADMPHGRLPPLDPFLTTLYENDVDGVVLLTTLDATTLRDDCGLKSLGVRSAVIRCITKLRHESVQYTAESNPQLVQTPASLPAPASPPTPAPREAVLPSTENVDEHIRPREVQVQDVQGRKRRKLNLSSLEHPNENENAQTANVQSSPTIGQGYFGDAKCSIDELFYGPTDLGREIGSLQADGDVLVYDTDREAELEDQNFQFGHQGKPVGVVRYVAAQLRHFLLNSETHDLRRQDREAIAILPYREALQNKARSATVFQFRDDNTEPIAVKEDAARLESGYAPDDEVQQSAGEWDFLVSKHKTKEDEVLPVYGESEVDDTENSVPIEDSEDVSEEADSRFLGADQVARVIDNTIKQYAADWNDSLPEVEEKKAWTVWKKTKGSRTARDLLIESAQAKIDHLTTRLNKMKNEMLLDVWRNDHGLLKACEVLEVTVQDREEQRWMITVWKRRQEPAHVVQHTNKSTHQALKTPVTEVKGEKGFIVHTNDRLSVSPVPGLAADESAAAGHAPATEDEIRYEADDEEFHTPGDSPNTLPEPSPTPLEIPDEFTLSPEEFQNANSVKDDPDTELSDNPDYPVDGSEPRRGDKDEDYSPEEQDSESEELPDPSTFYSSWKSAPGRSGHTNSSIAPIDLTQISSDSSTPKKRGRPSTQLTVPTGDPLDAKANDVDSWDFQGLAKTADRIRILMKVLYEAGEKTRDQLDKAYKSLGLPSFIKQLHAACQAHKKSSTEGLDLNKSHVDILLRVACMCFKWAFPTNTEQETKALDRTIFNSAFNIGQIQLFARMLVTCLQRMKSKQFHNTKSSSSKSTPAKPGPSSTPILISSGDEGREHHRTPHKIRKREVHRSAAAQSSRAMAFQRQQKFIESQTASSSQLQAMLSDPSHSAVGINPVKDDGVDSIYICDKIAKEMKPHQIEGARFLWREITADDEDGAQGCVLAHTMGLGKTMQTIALLAAVNEAAQSDEQSVYGQLPPHLRPDRIQERNLRVLILCPPALIQNWRREIDYWAHHKLGQMFSLDSLSKTSHVQQLEAWMRLGGVVLMGYQMFRSALSDKTPKSNQKNARSGEDSAMIKKMLVEGSEIVIADEAHNLKNNKSGVATAADLVETHSRIGLTGTPMSNDVQEIYALVSWVAPGYLGNEAEFRAHFTEPIKEGLWQDSTAYERRKSIKKLKVLQADIEPKVNRANIEVLRGSLKPKVEFVITVALKETQVELYKRCIKTLLSEDSEGKASQVTVFGWLAVLTLLTNHPRCFYRKLTAPPSRSSAKGKKDDDNETFGSRTPSAAESGFATPAHEGIITTTEQLIDAEATKEAPGDEHVYALGFNAEMVRQILGSFQGDMDPRLSAKTSIFLKLLDYTLHCGDKALVFSSSIPTLEYLDELLRHYGKRFGRIDGSTQMAERMDALEDFDKGKFDIMLVSTKAGGVGLNIQRANRVFIIDYGFNPAWEEQAIGRAYRLGQEKPVYVYRFLAGGTFETNIYNKQLFKSSLAQRVVDKKNPRRTAERNTREYLYEPKSVEQENLKEEAGRDPMVLDHLLDKHGSEDEGKFDTMIRAIKTMETLQEEAMDAPLDEEEQQEVNMEIQQGRLRPRGRKAMNTAAPTTLRPYANGSTIQPPPNLAPPSIAPVFKAPPANLFHGHPMGGLPMPPSIQQPYYGYGGH